MSEDVTEVEGAIEAVLTARAASMDPKELFGGPRDWIDQSVPTATFVLANLIGGLRAGIEWAIAAEVVLILIRLVKRETLRHAFSGAFGVVIATLFAAKTHSAKNFFVPGIIINAAYALAFFVSVAIRRPIVGVILRFVLEKKPRAWHDHPRVKRAYAEATIGWGLVSLARVVVQESLRRANLVGWLGAAKIAMGYPLYIAALALTVPYVNRRTRGLEVPADPEPETGGEDAAEDAP